jgi:hypothetical protein
LYQSARRVTGINGKRVGTTSAMVQHNIIAMFV